MSTLSSIILSLSVTFSALAKMLASSPGHLAEAMANWCATSVAPGIMGLNDRRIFTYLSESSHFGAGCGARTYKDGVDTGGIIINTTASMPSIETTEAEYPVLYLFRRQIPDSGGPGRFRGGVTAGLALTPYDPGGPTESSFSGCGAEIPNAFGLAGGLPGAAVRYFRFTGTSIRSVLEEGRAPPADLGEIDGRLRPTFISRSHAPFPLDSVEYHSWQGGGGYGDPLDRDPARVVADVTHQLVSPQAAREIYGVVLADGGVDESATASLRDRIRRERVATGRPAAELLDAARELQGEDWIDTAPGHGSLRYGDAVELDFDTDQARCLRCRRSLTRARADFRRGCLVQVAPVTAAGPGRGEDYDRGRVSLRLYFCPGCGRQLETEVVLEAAPDKGFRLAPLPS